MSLDTFVKILRRPFQFREFLDQTWMIARVSLIPTLLVAIPFTVLVAFTLNILLRELGAADLSGAGTAFGTITQLGPGGDGAGGRRRRCDGDLRRPRRPHHPRGDRRDAGARHRPDPAAGRAARAGLDVRGAAAQRSGLRDRPRGRLRLLGVPAGRQPRRLHQRPDDSDRPWRADARLREGHVVRSGRRPGRLLPRSDRAGWPQGRRRSRSTRPWSTRSSACS